MTLSNGSTQRISRRKMIQMSSVVVTALTQANLQAAAPVDEKELIFRTTEPRNGEPDLADLIKSWLTPTKYFYVRSHAPNPVIDADNFRLTIDGMVERTQSLSLKQLKQLPEHTITATLTCAGNRRAEFNSEKAVGGVQWGSAAIGNATWTGVALADVLKLAGLKSEVKHICFEGLDQVEEGSHTIGFGASIPVEKAIKSEEGLGALLVYKMNGEQLTADHGYPLRTVVPGYIGARSVKWLGKITASDRPSLNHFIATAYKLVRETGALDWEEAAPIYRYVINAAIGSIAENSVLKPGPLTVSGYVLPSGRADALVKQVMVSADMGKTWQPAQLQGQQSRYCWQLWQVTVDITTETKQLWVRANDNQGGFMPYRTPWNAKGYMQNSWFKLPVSVQ
ncbi:MAG: sulfite oxidase [Planctomycetales bacterium]|nr:sulfite oxidase [Planctomycetales bacterium]